MRVRRLVHSLGYRYRLHRKDLPGNTDWCFRSGARLFLFTAASGMGMTARPQADDQRRMRSIGAQSWPDCGPGMFTNQALLREQGWDVLIVWECDLKRFDDLTGAIRRS